MFIELTPPQETVNAYLGTLKHIPNKNTAAMSHVIRVISHSASLALNSVIEKWKTQFVDVSIHLFKLIRGLVFVMILSIY